MSEEQLLAEVVQRTLTIFPDARIVLFGSRASGQGRADSDYDLAIVAPGARPGPGAGARLRLALYGLGVGLDLVLATPAEWEAMLAAGNSVASEAQARGRVLHAAA
jgi:predicted nucleotidyltransferase